MEERVVVAKRGGAGPCKSGLGCVGLCWGDVCGASCWAHPLPCRCPPGQPHVLRCKATFALICSQRACVFLLHAEFCCFDLDHRQPFVLISELPPLSAIEFIIPRNKICFYY